MITNQARVKSSFNKLLFCLTSENHTANFYKSLASLQDFHLVEWLFHLHKKTCLIFLRDIGLIHLQRAQLATTESCFHTKGSFCIRKLNTLRIEFNHRKVLKKRLITGRIQKRCLSVKFEKNQQFNSLRRPCKVS